MAKMIMGILPYKNDAENAIAELEDRNYNPKDLSIIMKGDDNKVAETGGKVAGGTLSGATTGAVAGALAGGLFGYSGNTWFECSGR